MTSGTPSELPVPSNERRAPQGARVGEDDREPRPRPVQQREDGIRTVSERRGTQRAKQDTLRSKAPWLFRRGLVLIVVVVVTTATALAVSSAKQATYSSDAILLVNPGATPTSPGSSQEAQALAATFAGLIPSDNALLHAVASATGLSLAQAKSGTSVTVVNGTSLLDLRFTAQNPTGATTGVSAMSQAISGITPATRAIPSGTITVVRDAGPPISHAQKPATAAALGLILGLFLAAVIMIIWERADARIDKAGQITASLGVPARSLDSLNVDSAAAMLDHWKSSTQREDPKIALLSAVPGMHQSTVSAGRRLGRLAPGMQLLVGGAPGEENGDRVAQLADVTVLLVPQEARVRAVQQSRDYLEQLGIQPTWALMISERVH